MEDKARKLQDANDADEIWTYHRCRDFEAKDPLERRLLEQGITPVYDPAHRDVPCFRQLVPDILDFRVFLNAPGPKSGGHFQCHIYRKHEPNMLYSRYKLCLGERDRFLLSARKRKKSRTSNYAISIDENDISNKTGNYFGKLRSNFVRTEFLVYDKGQRPSFEPGKCLSSKSVRVEVGGVIYRRNVFGRGRGRMTAVIPALAEDLKPCVFQPLTKGSSTILDRYKSGRELDRMTVLHNKCNVEERHGQASKRNFQV
ncbi:hypothetical protein SELMODRAFT_402012 [Selaginella moellendorffii]|uniref:Tubby C-terminal domain-containing protein n=1 Tax=Selaginella moellendorffii TaxID=88036 RepID=D8QPA9_SELML|nr:hypothetical protein SELMODRAFT_402012 [Selaginella moellendorffii]